MPDRDEFLNRSGRPIPGRPPSPKVCARSAIRRPVGIGRPGHADSSLIEIVLDGANGSFRDPAAGEGAVWFANVEADLIYRVDPASGAGSSGPASQMA